MVYSRIPPSRPKEQPDVTDIVASLPVAMLLVDPANIIADANSRAEALFNMARSALVGSDIRLSIRMDPDDARFDLWRSDQPIAAYDLMLHLGRREALRADVMIAPIADHEGWRVVTVHSQSLAQSIGGHRRIAGALSATGAAAMLAHEIKNPLSGIRGAAQLLDTGDDGGEGQGNHTLTSLICTEVDRIAALIDRMQDFTTERKLECRPENIYPVLDRAIRVAQAGFARGIRIVRRYDPSLPLPRCNVDALTQVMLNLLKNAAEALSDTPAPVVRIETAFRHGVTVMLGEGRGSSVLPIEIVVIDNGPGVPPALQEHLFSPFISTKPEGQGLGLALVDKLVRDMDGFVQYSRNETAGESIFRILLPMGEAA